MFSTCLCGWGDPQSKDMLGATRAHLGGRHCNFIKGCVEVMNSETASGVHSAFLQHNTTFIFHPHVTCRVMHLFILTVSSVRTSDHLSRSILLKSTCPRSTLTGLEESLVYSKLPADPPLFHHNLQWCVARKVGIWSLQHCFIKCLIRCWGSWQNHN